MLKFLKVFDFANAKQKEFNGNKVKVMTSAIIHYLRRQFSEESEALALIYAKAEAFLAKWG